MIVKGRRIISVPVPEPTGSQVLIYGDSISAGANASSPSLAYYSIYGNLTGLQVFSRSSYSRTVQEGLQNWNLTNSLENVIFSPTADQAQYQPVTPYDPNVKYIMIRLGVNDAIQSVSPATPVNFMGTYARCIERFIELGWPRNRLKLIDIGSYRGSNSNITAARLQYNSNIVTLGSTYRLQVIKISEYDLTQDINSMYDDDVHPNDNGHLKHGTYLANLLN